MIPFPGESVRLGDAVDLTGGGEDYTLLEPLSVRAGSRTFGAGSAWRAWVYQGDVTYLEESGLGCDVSWVVEVTAGTATLSAGELLDPTYSDITSATSPLGTYTVTGPATLVIPSGFTADQVRTGGDSLLFELVGVSGSATVQQVKLRVWPTTGALGGWSDPLPSWSTSPGLPSGYEVGVGVFPALDASTQEASWDATMAQAVTDWPAAAAGPHMFTAIPASSGYLAPVHGGKLNAFHSSGDGGATWGTTASLQGAILVVAGVDWATRPAIDPTLVDGVDYIRPPNEVRGEAGAYLAQQIGTGSTGWLNAAAVVTTASEVAPVPAPTIATSDTDDLTITNLGGGSFGIDLDATIGTALTTPASSESVVASVTLPTSGRYIIVDLGHTAALTPPAWPGGETAGAGVAVNAFGVGTPGADFAPTLTYATLPPYRVWLPTAVVQEPLRLRQRADGLGSGSVRVRGVASRQHSVRVRGYL